MGRPSKQVSVSKELRKQWLKKHEEDGESPPHIAQKEGYDVRTVRKHIELAQQERETRETRLMILRGAVESHYRDLCKFAERIDSTVAHGEPTSSLKADRMYMALHQHIPKSLLWKFLDKWNSLHQTISETRASLNKRISEGISGDFPLNEAFHGGEKDIAVMVEFFIKQSEFWSKGGAGLEIEHAFKMEPDGSGMVRLKVGAYYIGTVAEAQAPLVKKALIDFKQGLFNFDEFQKLKQFPNELEKLRPDIQEELAIITLRRIVPGKCKYCPV